MRVFKWRDQERSMSTVMWMGKLPVCFVCKKKKLVRLWYRKRGTCAACHKATMSPVVQGGLR
jgi:hypothetical protein